MSLAALLRMITIICIAVAMQFDRTQRTKWQITTMSCQTCASGSNGDGDDRTTTRNRHKITQLHAPSRIWEGGWYSSHVHVFVPTDDGSTPSRSLADYHSCRVYVSVSLRFMNGTYAIFSLSKLWIDVNWIISILCGRQRPISDPYRKYASGGIFEIG